MGKSKLILTLRELEENEKILVSNIDNIVTVQQRKYLVSSVSEGGGVIVPKLREATVLAMEQYEKFSINPPHIITVEYNR